MYLNTLTSNSYDNAWAIYLQNGTSDQVILRNPYQATGPTTYAGSTGTYISLFDNSFDVHTIFVPFTVRPTVLPRVTHSLTSTVPTTSPFVLTLPTSTPPQRVILQWFPQQFQ
jgi:hypothetical protein